jgi:outer membrane lipoprotein-sorting protein
MYYANARHLQAFLFLILTVFLSSTAFATDRNDLAIKTQTARAQVSGMDVSLEQVSGTAVMTTKTDEKGSFTFSNVAPGSYKLRIGCDTPVQAVPGSAQKCHAEVRIVITEKSTGVIRGTIRKES